LSVWSDEENGFSVSVDGFSAVVSAEVFVVDGGDGVAWSDDVYEFLRREGDVKEKFSRSAVYLND
jgi:hypothetical protein